MKTGDAEHDARYYTYAKWNFIWGCGFLRVPIGKWRWWPYFGWHDQVIGVAWLFVILKWSQSWSYVEREDWKLQSQVNQITNMQIDNLTRGVKPDWRAGIKDDLPERETPEGVMGTPPYDHDNN